MFCAVVWLGTAHALLAPPTSLRRPLTKGVRVSEVVDEVFEEDDKAAWAWTRRTVALISTLGVAETTYLTSQKLIGSAAVCAADCSSVLTGPYSSIGGVPVSALGLVGYAVVLGLCAAPRLDADLERKTRTPLVAVTAAMAAFSAWLIALLVLKLQAFCGFCFASAAMSWSNFALTQRASNDEASTWPAVGGMAAATFMALLTFYFVETGVALDEARRSMVALVAPNEAALVAKDRSPLAFAPPEVDTVSTERTLRLARHLKERDATMYGAYWCSHCFAQKQAFGAEAAKLLNYVECADDGQNQNRAACQDRGIAGYPTWDIDGKLYPGERSIAELEELVGLGPPP